MDAKGPQARIKFKKVQKRSNCADKFREEHKKFKIEKREDPTKIVRRHNKTTPKLVNELKKRKSITTVTTIKLKDIHSEFDPKCSACAKFITLSELQKLQLKPRCPKNTSEDSRKEPEETLHGSDAKKLRARKAAKLSGIKKAKFRIRDDRDIRFSQKNYTNKSCQCVADDNRPNLKNTNSVHEEKSEDVIIKESRSFQATDKERLGPQAACPNYRTIMKSSDQSFKSRNHSVSTYNSYVSLDHEPMESMDIN